VSDATENSENSTLQDPALNPLLNPLLASHLGRWAEVYFTSPPELRAHAVANLIRELEQEAAPGTTNVESSKPAQKRATESLRRADYTQAPPLLARTEPPPPQRERTVCTKCGQENPRGQKFCGMCGSRLNPEAEPKTLAEPSKDDQERSAEADSVSHEPALGSEWANETRPIGGESRDYAPDADEAISHHSYDSGDEEDEDWSYSSLGDEDLPHFAREPESVPYRYRLYVGLVIAIVLVGLIYLARNGTEIFSSGQQSPASRTILPAQTPNTAEPVGTAPPAPVQKVEKDEAPPAQAVKPATKQERIPPQETATARPLARTGSSSARSARAPVPNATTALPAGGGSFGAEENAEAQKYLSQRNPAEAAQWLWKAVAKGNAGATVTLADLYLHGNGVPKNCDQGRLLLDIGAKKGAHGAAERLRNLQAFGCR
jgi:hypothetical protein